MAERKLTGKISPERILMTVLPKPDPDLIAGFRFALGTRRAH